LKYHLIKIFSFLKDSKPRNFRLWVLENNVSFDQFEEYIVKSLSSYRKAYVNFPGILLDNFENNMIGDIDEILQNKIMVLEHLDASINDSIQFNKQGHLFGLNNSVV